MAFRGDMNALILGTLSREALHGYEIVRRIREAGGAAKLSEGQIYPYLHKLEELGQVTAHWETDTGAAPKRVYELTPKGRQELDKQRALWERFAAGVGSLLSAKIAKTEGGNV
jgi:DNA-binding PadR family transcriptional regulator